MLMWKRNLRSMLAVLLLVAVMTFILFPVFYSVVFSTFNRYEENKPNSTQLLPRSWNWQNYTIALQSGYWQAFAFSFGSALLLVVIRLAVCGTAGYALARKNPRFRRTMLALFALAAVVPEHALYLGLLTRVKEWQLDRGPLLFLGLVAPSIFSLFTILIFRDGFASISKSHQNLMRIDRLTLFQKVALIFWPQLRYAVVFTVVITTIGAWNSYLWPVVFLPPNQHTLSTYVFALGNELDGSISYSIKLAAVVIYTLPALLFYALFHRRIIRTFNRL